MEKPFAATPDDQEFCDVTSTLLAWQDRREQRSVQTKENANSATTSKSPPQRGLTAKERKQRKKLLREKQRQRKLQRPR